jgi:hypothetical protein
VGVALLDPPKVLKGNPGVAVKAPSAFVALIEEETKAASKAAFEAMMKATEKALISKSPATCPCGCGGPAYADGPGWSIPPLPPQLLADRKQRALEWVNALRTEWGLPALAELPKGTLRNSNACVLARALPHAAKVDVTVLLKTGARVTLPSECIDFIRAFDGGQYPELIA